MKVQFLVLSLGLFSFFANLKDLNAQETTITSQTLRLVEGEHIDHFYFAGEVEVHGEDLFVSCEALHVLSLADAESSSGTKVQMGKIEHMEASGKVYIRQGEKEAWAEEAEVLPQEEKMILTHNARLKDERGVVEGHRITIFQDQKEAIVEGASDKASRPTLVIHQLPQKKTENSESSSHP